MTVTPDLAQSSPSQRGRMFVIYTGLITTAATWFGVYWINSRAPDFNIMGWYANYVIPMGALIVGVAAGSGYGIGSAISGAKISARLLLVVVALQIVAYFVAQYIEYRNLVAEFVPEGQEAAIGFWEYFHLTAVSFAWQQRGGEMGEPLGMWGYAFKALEIAGFAGGGLIVPAVMRARPYCDTCQRYMKTRELGVIPAAIPARKVKKSDTDGLAAYEAEQQKAWEEGSARYEQLCALVSSGDAEALRRELAPLIAGKKVTEKLPRRMEMALVTCDGCSNGRLVTKVLTGTGDKTTTELLPPVEVSPDFVRAFVRT